MTQQAAESLARELENQGFDLTTIDSDDEGWPATPVEWSVRPRCSRCEVLVINGVATHEQGCPNSRRRDRCDEE